MNLPARQAIVVIYRATFQGLPGWRDGPLPVAHGELHASTAARCTSEHGRNRQAWTP